MASADLAIALHDTIANIADWLFIIGCKPFKVGDRIQIGDTAGDVIDIRIFQFSMVEIGKPWDLLATAVGTNWLLVE